MKRNGVCVAEIVAVDNLVTAFYRAAKGKRTQPEVRAFAANLNQRLTQLSQAVLEGNMALGRMTSFRIHDPKPRTIHAPCFAERVLHHALMAHAGPVLDRSLIYDTYACRLGKGALAAVQRVQQHTRRFRWYATIDVRAYFASIDHRILMALLHRRFKNKELLSLMARMVKCFATTPGKGLPIGALTSQHFANYYLGGFDRFLLENPDVRGLVRYMDDVVWWADSRTVLNQTLVEARIYLQDKLALSIKPPVMGRSQHGVSFCGYRLLPGAMLLSRRRKRRYAACRSRWEQAHARGEIDELALQRGYDTALAMTAQADAKVWRQAQLKRVPISPTLERV